MTGAANLSLWLVGAGVFLTTHLLWLGRVAGLHYDEAWAANFSHRIAIEPGFWPVHAMSPYTSAWSHYVAALFFRLFGTNLFVYRSSGIFLVLSGVAMLSLALARGGQRRAAALLPWLLAFFPAAILNHRFAIEINTFHVFCLGLLAWGASLRLFPTSGRKSSRALWLSDAMISSSVLLGITSHVLFVAPALAGLAVLLWRKESPSPRLRILLLGTLALLFLFFLRIHLAIPEKDKSLALLAIAAACGAGLAFPTLVQRVPQRLRGLALTAAVLLSLPAFFFLIFFSEGSWAAAFFSGGLADRRWIGWTLIAPAWMLASSRRLLWDLRWKNLFAWMALTLIIVAALAVKPAPRYFELPLVLEAVFLALLLGRLAGKRAALLLSCWALMGSLQLSFNYFNPGLNAWVPERTFRLGAFRDNSSDTLQKQALVAALAHGGCPFEKVTSDDPRLMEALRFLSLGDWQVAPGDSCPWKARILIQRRSQLGDAAPLSAELHLPDLAPGGPFRLTPL